MIEALVGICIGLVVGFFLGFLTTKRIFREIDYDKGFITGYDVVKGVFYNPSAKG